MVTNDWCINSHFRHLNYPFKLCKHVPFLKTDGRPMLFLCLASPSVSSDLSTSVCFLNASAAALKFLNEHFSATFCIVSSDSSLLRNSATLLTAAGVS